MNSSTQATPSKSRWLDRYAYVSTTLARAKVLPFPRKFGLGVLDRGSCESLKAGVHALALGVAALMSLYNAAAWLRRREQHLALNAVLYGALTEWERHQVTHHLTRCR